MNHLNLSKSNLIKPGLCNRIRHEDQKGKKDA